MEAPENGGCPGQHFVEDDAGSKDVAPRVDMLAEDLLRRHVLRRAEHRAGPGQSRFRFTYGHGTCEAEVEQLHAVRRQEDVGRLEVAVDQSTRVQRFERRERGEGNRHGLVERQRSAFEPRGQRLALEILHRDEEIPVLFTDVVELADIGMADRRRRPRLPPQPLGRIRIGGGAPDHLQRDGPSQPRIPRRIHDAHPALAERARYLVMPDGFHGICIIP